MGQKDSKSQNNFKAFLPLVHHKVYNSTTTSQCQWLLAHSKFQMKIKIIFLYLESFLHIYIFFLKKKKNNNT
jgi:hypothetical protein